MIGGMVRTILNTKHLLLTLFCAVAFLFPGQTHAIAPLPFGGLNTVTVPCTCSGMLWVFFSPLYPNPPFPLAGALVFVPGATTPHPHFLFGVITKWELGQYITPDPGICWVGAPPFCVVLPSLGIMFRAGTSG